MNQEVIIMHGIPASGKSTWAKQYVKDNTNYKRISRDDLRHMFDGYQFNKDFEFTITKVSMQMLEQLLRDRYSVVIDNTNLRPSYIKDYMKVIRKVSKDIKVSLKSFESTPYEICLERDANRPDKVGKEVIDRMMEQLRNNKASSLRKVIDSFDNDYCKQFTKRL